MKVVSAGELIAVLFDEQYKYRTYYSLGEYAVMLTKHRTKYTGNQRTPYTGLFPTRTYKMPNQ